MPFFNFRGKQIYYEITGKGDPLLFLHGNSVSSVLFQKEISYYSKYYTVIVFDYPGHGKSSRLERFAEDFWLYNAECALELLEYLNIDNTFVAGTSGGALVGLNLALIAPEKVTKLIADSFFGLGISKEESEKLVSDRIKAKRNFLNIQYWKNMHGTDWEYVVDRDNEVILRSGASSESPIKGDLTALAIPVMLIASSDDNLIPNILNKTDKVYELISNCRKEYYNYGKHTFMITQKEEFARLLFDFFEYNKGNSVV